LLIGTVGLAVLAIVLGILQLLLVREAWEMEADRLEIRRRLLGFSWGRQFRDGVLLLDAKYGQEAKGPSWQLAVRSEGRKQYLMRQGGVFKSSREEVKAIAALLAKHTGWPVTAVEREEAEAVTSAATRRDVPAELRAAGFRAGVDERLRLTIRTPIHGQLLVGIVLAVVGAGWTMFLADHAKSLAQKPAQQPLIEFGFFLVIAVGLVLGLAVVAVGVVIIFSRERWVVERNLLVIRSRLSGWKSEQQYVDGTLSLARVSRATEDGTVWSWELRLQNQAGTVLKVLRSDSDDDVPRLLGAVLSHHTGWPLREAEG
jgi:hypothetical protein